MKDLLVSICEKIILVAYGGIFLVTPLLICPWTHELFEFPKMLFVYAMAIVISAAFLIKSLIKIESFPQMLDDKWKMINKVPLAFPIIFYLSTFVVSMIFSVHPYTSIFGYYGRFHGGLLSLLAYVVLFLIYVSEFKEDKKRLLITSYQLLITGFLVSLYGILQHFGIDTHYWVQDSSVRVFSTLGQPNWLAAWLVMLLPLSWFFYFFSGKYWLTAVGWLLSAAFFASFWFTYSLSGLLGFVAALVVFVASMPKEVFFKKKLRTFLIITSYFLVVIVFPGLINRRVYELKKQVKVTRQVYAAQSSRGGGDTLEIRLIVWRGALDVWKSRPKNMLIGTGPETFAYVFLSHRPKDINQTSEWDFLYNKAHNEYADILVEQGLVGLVGYLFLVVSATFSFLPQITNYKFSILKNKVLKPDEKGFDNTKYYIPNTINFSAALLSGWVGFLVTNFFGFTVVPTALLFWLYPAISLSFQKYNKLP